MISLSTAGRLCFGAAVAASGLHQLVTGDFVRLVTKLPAWLGTGPSWPMFTGVLMLVAGIAIIANYRVTTAATICGALLLAAFVLKGLPDIWANPRAGYVWTNPAKMLALVGGALVLVKWAGKDSSFAALLLAVFLLICGAQHFVYVGFVDGLVPAWIPPSQRFWTLFCAVALLAGGLGLLLPRTRRIAGIWSGVMIFLWVFLVHVPLAAKNAVEWGGVYEALALAGTAWLIAGTKKTDAAI